MCISQYKPISNYNIEGMMTLSSKAKTVLTFANSPCS